MGEEDLPDDPYLALLDRWFRPRWSPDGQTVAFAAAREGRSADLHIYDVTRDELHRLDLENRTTELLYAESMQWVDLDPASGTIAMTVWDEGVQPGNVLLMRPGQPPSLPSGVDPDAFAARVRWYPELGRFLAESFADVTSFTPSGSEVYSFHGEICLPEASGDGLLLAFWGCGYDVGLRIYATTGEWKSEHDIGFVQDLAWTSVSDRLYVLAETDSGFQLAWVAPETGQVTVLDADARPQIATIELREELASVVRRLPTPEPTRPQPAHTPEPSPTAEVPLNATGPWLVGSGSDGMIAMNPDGTGREVLFGSASQGPDSRASDLWWDEEVSSAGWVAVRAASGEGTADPPRLLLARLPTTRLEKELPILSPDLAAKMLELDETGTRKVRSEDVYLSIHGAGFLDGLSWSPDGRTLAFVGAMDGPSADVYTYDTETDEVRRLTDGPNQPKLLGWSPDGRWVLHLEISDIFLADGISYEMHGLWAAATDGSGARLVEADSGSVLIAGWFSPTQFAALHYSLGPSPPFWLELVDLEPGSFATLYTGTVRQWAIDPVTRTVAFPVDATGFRDEDLRKPGLYFACPSTGAPRLVGFDDPKDDLQSGLVAEVVWSPELGSFLVRTYADGAYAVSTQGETVQYFDLFWYPNSSGLYYFQGKDPARLMFVPVEGGDPHLVHPAPGFFSDYWAPDWVGIP